MIKGSLQKKLIVIFLVLFTIPIVVSLLLFNYYATQYSRYSNELLNMRNIKYVGQATNDFFSSAYDFSLYLNSNPDILEYLSASQEELYSGSVSVSAQNAVSLLPFSNANIKSITVIGNDDRIIKSGVSGFDISSEEKQKARLANGSPCWNIDGDDISFVRLLRSPDKLDSHLGYLKIELNELLLKKLFSSQQDASLQYTVFLSESELDYTYKSDFDFTAPEVSEELLQSSTQKSNFLNENKCFLSAYDLECVEGYVYCLSDDNYSVKVFTVLLNTLLSSMAICFVFCFMLSLIFSATIVSPLKKMGKLMKCVENEDFSVKFEPKGNDEIAKLARQFDHMTDRLNVLYNQVYMDKLTMKEMELSTLQAQINPHFLYNTLDTIYWMSEINHTSDVSNMVSALSKSFRLVLSGDAKDMVKLKTELEHLECYLYIQKIRRDNNFKYKIINEADAENNHVLKLILQPLVENSVIHGIEKVGQGEINIRIYETQTDLIYEISDTAGTADIEKINKLLMGEDVPKTENHNQIGLRNIQTRIRLRYGDEYGVKCHINNGKTVFTVNLPLNQ